MSALRKSVREEIKRQNSASSKKDKDDDDRESKPRNDSFAAWADDSGLPQRLAREASKFSSENRGPVAEDQKKSVSDETHPIKTLKKKRSTEERRNSRD